MSDFVDKISKAFEAEIFRLVAPDDADYVTEDVIGIGVDFPNDSVYVDWRNDVFEDELENSHVSIYGSVEDLEQATDNIVEVIDSIDAVDKSVTPSEIIDPNNTIWKTDVEKMWVPYVGPEEGEGWQNVENGEVRYVEEPPGPVAEDYDESDEGDGKLDVEGVKEVFGNIHGGLFDDGESNDYNNKEHATARLVIEGRTDANTATEALLEADNIDGDDLTLDGRLATESLGYRLGGETKWGVNMPYVTQSSTYSTRQANQEFEDEISWDDRITNIVDGGINEWQLGMFTEETAPMFQLAADITGNETLPEGGAYGDSDIPSVLDMEVAYDEIEAFEAKMEQNQEVLREAFGDTITVYRGINSVEGNPTHANPSEASDKMLEAKERGEGIVHEHRPIESWTTNPSYSTLYATGDAQSSQNTGVMLRKEVPVERVMASSHASELHNRESEVIVMHDEEEEYSNDDIISSEQITNRFLIEEILSLAEGDENQFKQDNTATIRIDAEEINPEWLHEEPPGEAPEVQKTWVPYIGPEGGEGWQSTDDPEDVRYEEEPPGTVAGEDLEDNPLEEGDYVLLEYDDEIHYGKVIGEYGDGGVSVQDDRNNWALGADESSQYGGDMMLTNLGKPNSDQKDPDEMEIEDVNDLSYALNEQDFLEDKADFIYDRLDDLEDDQIIEAMNETDSSLLAVGSEMVDMMSTKEVNGVSIKPNPDIDETYTLLDDLEEEYGEETKETSSQAARGWEGSMYAARNAAPMVQAAMKNTGNETMPEYDRSDMAAMEDVSDDKIEQIRQSKEFTVDILREAYGDEITVFRGLSENPHGGTRSEGTDIVQELKDGKNSGDSVTVEHRPLESWTLEPSTAQLYGDVVIENTIPVESVMASSSAATIHPSENDTVVEHEGPANYSPEQIYDFEDRDEDLFRLRLNAARGMKKNTEDTEKATASKEERYVPAEYNQADWIREADRDDSEASESEEKQEEYTYPRTPAEDAQPEVKDAVRRFREEVDTEEKKNEPLLYWLLGSGTPPYKMEKADADYDVEPYEGQKCANCEFYYEGVDGQGVCSQVRGDIGRKHWCRLWQGVPQSEYEDNESGVEVEESVKAFAHRKYLKEDSNEE